jgi:predicted metalloprotease
MSKNLMADWSKIGSSGNVEDRRGASMIGGLGLVGTIIILGFTYLSSGGDLGAVLDQLQGTGVSQQQFQSTDMQKADDYPAFASAVLGSNNDLWRKVFSENGRRYEEPKLVLFRGLTQSACGGASSEIGPHYCPVDSTIYLDETFFDELQRRFNAKGGDVAEAYVIAHEVGHHVQNQLGSLASTQGREDNQASVRMELQADCYAGVWANSISTLGVLEPGEIAEALDAAAAVGDDRIQKATTGRTNPETWTHGSSAQRTEWFNRGFSSGNPTQCSIAS